MIPLQNVSLPAICWGAQALALEVLDEDDFDQVEAEKADAPEADHARESEHHADERVPRQRGSPKSSRQRAQLGLAGAARSRPLAPRPSTARAP